MTSYPFVQPPAARKRPAPFPVILTLCLASAACLSLVARADVVLWDTASPLAPGAKIEDRAGWKRVPSDLFKLEANPPKASSDPGYYGREYVFKGDAVVENDRLTAVFVSSAGKIELYAKMTGATNAAGPGRKIGELAPLQPKATAPRIRRCDIIRNAGDEVVLEVVFLAQGAPEVSATVTIGRGSIVEWKPGDRMKGIELIAPLAYGVAPGFVGDDLIIGPADADAPDLLHVPADNIFLGLLRGGDAQLVVTWPKGKQQLRLKPGAPEAGQRPLAGLELQTDGQSVYLAALTAPGIWHREPLNSSFLEQDKTSAWKKPFAAKWQTQLLEGNVKTTFALRESKGEIWRGVPGSYNYPVWFQGDQAVFHLSKKVPPKGEALIYFVEGENTPANMTTPVDILKETLGRAQSEPVLDVAGRKLRTHHRRGGSDIRRSCTCGYTEAIQAVFEAGAEVKQKGYIDEALTDMIYFVRCHLDRIDEYRKFADETAKYLRTQAEGATALKPYLETLEGIAQQIPQEYTVQLENMKSLAHARELAKQTAALSSRQDPGNLAAYMELSKAWRAMGGAQDYVVAQCHTIARKLFQEAGQGALTLPGAADVARETRARCRQILRNPDGYEIWPNY